MKDIFGNELTVGDEVAFLRTVRHSAYFTKGKVVGFTPQMVKIEYQNPYYGNAPHSPDSTLKSPYLMAKNNKVEVK